MVWTNSINPNRETPPVLRVENTRAHLAILEKKAFPLIEITVCMGTVKKGSLLTSKLFPSFLKRIKGTVGSLAT